MLVSVPLCFYMYLCLFLFLLLFKKNSEMYRVTQKWNLRHGNANLKCSKCVSVCACLCLRVLGCVLVCAFVYMCVGVYQRAFAMR